MFIEILQETTRSIESLFWAMVFFGALYFFFWYSGATQRANRLPESFWIVKLRFISSCLILTIWTYFAIREIEDIDIFQYPISIAFITLYFVLPVIIAFIDIIRQYKQYQ